MLKRFITHPILSCVISIFIIIAGVLSVRELPVELYPDILPPTVSVSTMYPGASPETISSLVAAPLEKQINGVDDMIYIQSVVSQGQLSINVYFETGTDPDLATVNVSNRIQGVLSSLPQEVQKQGVTIRKRSGFIMSIFALTSDTNIYDTVYLNNYANLNILSELTRVPGVGDAQIFGAKLYAMRVWLNTAKMKTFGISVSEVLAVIQSQNQQQPVGIIGAAPMEKAVDVTFAVTDVGNPTTEEDFRTLVIKSLPDGQVLRLQDIARVELGSEIYNFSSKYDGKDSASIGIFLAPGANAVDVDKRVRATLDQLSKSFPEGISITPAFDTTRFIHISIQGVIGTLFEAIVLVVIVMYIFLQNFRATIIPCLAIPISIVGAFAGLYVLGFSLNLFTLFAFILAIGIVVDDAIIVIENVERIMSTEKLPAVPATIKAMEEITAPVIASTLVLCSVFIPIAFLGGLAGVMYKQFAVTIAVSVSISAVVALTLTPAMCALLLKPHEEGKKHFLDFFNRGLEKFTNWYASCVAFFLRHVFIGLGLFTAIVVLAIWGFNTLPTSLVPQEDQGYIMGVMVFPEGSSIARPEKAEAIFRDHVLAQQTTGGVMSLIGYDFLTGSARENYAVIFISLTDWSKRTTPETSADAIVSRLAGFAYMAVPDAYTLVLNPPPIPGLSNTGGLQMYLQNKAGVPLPELQKVADAFAAKLNQLPEVTNARSLLATNTPRVNVKVDKAKAIALGVPVNDVYSAMQATIGYAYVNQFTLYDRPFKVLVQADSEFRRLKDAFEKIYVTSTTTGKQIPISELIERKDDTGVTVLERFNTYTAASIMADPAPGFSSGQAITAIENAALKELQNTYSIAWTGAAYQEKVSQSGTLFVFSLAAFFVLLILAALYESVSLPIAVMASVPIALLGAVLASLSRSLSNDLYFQVAIVTLIGLAAKTAILIVEFAVQLRDEGYSIDDAAIKASILRFRPVLMTMISFILGSLPLVLTKGAGTGSKLSLGTAIIGGMVMYTIFGTLLIPFFYKLVTVVTNIIKGRKEENSQPSQPKNTL